ncbi:hypothetical protein HCB18_27465 [Salinispora arenicola]|nr:hypothetical protein [Salinispora arenicola]
MLQIAVEAMVEAVCLARVGSRKGVEEQAGVRKIGLVAIVQADGPVPDAAVRTQSRQPVVVPDSSVSGGFGGGLYGVWIDLDEETACADVEVQRAVRGEPPVAAYPDHRPHQPAHCPANSAITAPRDGA